MLCSQIYKRKSFNRGAYQHTVVPLRVSGPFGRVLLVPFSAGENQPPQSLTRLVAKDCINIDEVAGSGQVWL